MPSDLSQEQLEKSIKDTTARIGRLKRSGMEEGTAMDRARRWRSRRVMELAERFNRWTLINEEGKTEFVDRAEFEHRMVAWARRTGQLPAVRFPAVAPRRPATPPAPAAPATPDSPATTQAPPQVPPTPPTAERPRQPGEPQQEPNGEE